MHLLDTDLAFELAAQRRAELRSAARRRLPLPLRLRGGARRRGRDPGPHAPVLHLTEPEAITARPAEAVRRVA